MTDVHPVWQPATADVATLLRGARLQLVEPSSEQADRLLDQAERHLATARATAVDDPTGAFSLLDDGRDHHAARKAMVAVLAAQGLRPTGRGGHRVVQEALAAQLGAGGRQVIRRFRELRTRRNESEYPDVGTAEVTTDEVTGALDSAELVVRTMRRLLPDVRPWDPGSR